MALKTFELRKQSQEKLGEQLQELRQELASLRVQKIAGGSGSKLSKIKTTRKDIARILTVINQSNRLAVREAYKNKKYLPLDLRQKKTRAIRRALTPYEKSRKTLKQVKKDRYFPLRKYALKA
ncbi:60S ribosomal protein L35 [Schizosaccharomyces cryophilus OY26]|uniref:60S ribosomal protein L35 n=1 Tax=Schizosaccharomyces cryophilus (strain OY26 / ATCC MYA-4695 / CBS 11777 / NBRC 106824 / NRRL Y48691) TaxID=653667 RepID=S9X3A9_SCHCR|nr:60S ribosomal protein L35 [Schizosaccharomyces cryophilus OY26]EPY51597.1 60S ribosomal protein L35 [Schizosaccharomyces cryophilus OY26]